MSSTAHSHHNYIKIFIILSVLTAVEIGVTFLGLPRTLLVALLVGLAVWKAALVALHFMHLKIEKKTLTIVAIIPFILCVFLSLMLLPDIYPR
ncbi:MAG: cytochrome C oxidase subunit IV family protein [Candidatus Binatia bacterium]|jgi:caa(3)-type oxidase subunit IV|nr:cytochrome C oxidase subunit IV family protein [Candidatus Deferrimicrobium sp.]